MHQYTLPRATCKQMAVCNNGISQNIFTSEYDYLQSVEGESHEKAVDLLKAAQSKFENLLYTGGKFLSVLCLFRECFYFSL